jgi:pimeloyl-ACP methyl ester carboxylesterase
MSAESRFHTRQVEANGIQYSLIDEGEGPPVVLLHGFPDTASLWRHQIPALVAAGFRAVAPDLRGRGQTQAPPRVEDYALAGMVADVAALLDTLGIDRAHLVGHDFGAGLAWLAGSLLRQRVDHLVVLSVGHPATRERPTLEQLQKSWYQLLFQFEGVAEELLQQDDWYLFREFLQGDGDVEDYIAELSRLGALTAALNWYRASFPVQRLAGPRPRAAAAAGAYAGHLEHGRSIPLGVPHGALGGLRQRPVAVRAHGGGKPLDPARSARGPEQAPAGVLANPECVTAAART